MSLASIAFIPGFAAAYALVWWIRDEIRKSREALHQHEIAGGRIVAHRHAGGEQPHQHGRPGEGRA